MCSQYPHEGAKYWWTASRENGLARCVPRPEESEMTAAPSKHHTDVNSVVHLCATLCVVIDLVLLSGILRNFANIKSVHRILYFFMYLCF